MIPFCHFSRFVTATPLLPVEPHTYHVDNGLPPGGPRMTHLRITAPNGAAGKARKHHQETYFKPVPGTIDDVVQVCWEEEGG